MLNNVSLNPSPVPSYFNRASQPVSHPASQPATITEICERKFFSVGIPRYSDLIIIANVGRGIEEEEEEEEDVFNWDCPGVEYTLCAGVQEEEEEEVGSEVAGVSRKTRMDWPTLGSSDLFMLLIQSCSLRMRDKSTDETEPLSPPRHPTPLHATLRVCFVGFVSSRIRLPVPRLDSNPQWDDAPLKRVVGGFRDYSCGSL